MNKTKHKNNVYIITIVFFIHSFFLSCFFYTLPIQNIDVSVKFHTCHIHVWIINPQLNFIINKAGQEKKMFQNVYFYPGHNVFPCGRGGGGGGGGEEEEGKVSVLLKFPSSQGEWVQGGGGGG